MRGNLSRFAVLAAAVLAGGLMGCSTESPQTDGLEVLQSALPAEAGGWRRAGEDQVFDTESIFSYIDGHAEVYLSFGMKRNQALTYDLACRHGIDTIPPLPWGNDLRFVERS